MVSGFNTDIMYDGAVYHVQTELRKQAGIETAVYVKGAIIHSLKTSYQDLLNGPDYSEDKLKQLLEGQHRQVIEQIRSGGIEAPGAQISNQ